NGGAAPAGVTAKFIYATDLFDAESVAGFARRFLRILKAVAATPDRPVGDIPMLDAREADQLLRVWNNSVPGLEPAPSAPTALADPAATLTGLFDAAAAANGDRVAARFGDGQLTYTELDRRANRLARRLIAAGAGPERLVAVLLPRSIELVVAL